MMLYRLLVLFFSLQAILSCEMFESHPYDGNVSGEKNMNVKNIMRIEDACKNKATIRFAFISDTQYHYDETEAFVNAVNQRNDIDFVIHGGDITEYSMTGEFLRIRDLMNKLHVPYIALTGNHDCLATGRDIFRRVFGPEDFSFLAGNIKFVCLNTNSLEFDYAENVPDLDFMKKQADDSRPAYEKTVIVMHAAPFSNQFDGQRVYDFQQQLRNYKGLQFCLHGHNHGLTIDDFFEDGVIYYGVSSIEKHKYLLYTFNPDHEYGYEVTDF